MSLIHIYAAAIVIIVSIVTLARSNSRTRLTTDTDSDSIVATRRHVACLSFLKHATPEMSSHQRFQKLMFLLDHDETESEALYSYKKYDYGPYAKHLRGDLKDLDRHDYIDITETVTVGGTTRYSYRLTEDGKEALDTALEKHDFIESLHERTEAIFAEHGDTPISNLIVEVQENHSEYWENSVYRPY